MSNRFGETLRKAPADAVTTGHGLLVRAGYIRPVAPGIFSYLPLGVRTLRRIRAVIRAEIEAIGGEEVAMPLVQPAKLLRKSGRWARACEELVRFDDRGDRKMALGTSHEEVAAELARTEIHSYRQLPALLYQIGKSFRDEERPQGGTLRAREFTLMDSYSLDPDAAGQDRHYKQHFEAFERIFRTVGLSDVIPVVSGPSTAGEAPEHEFMFVSDAGDDAVSLCDSCGYSANQRVAAFARPGPAEEEPLPLEKVATPGTDTIESLADFLGVTTDRTAKVVFFSKADDRDSVIMALVRGDMEVSETKLAAAVGTWGLFPAEPEAIRATGAAPGYASPIGLDSEKLSVVVDPLVAASANLVSGANEEGFHFRNVNFKRDYQADRVVDIAATYEGAPCPACRSPLRIASGLEVGSLHRFGPDYGSALGATYRDESDEEHPIVMGSYGIGVDRLLACIAESHHDDHGLCLPITVAPYQVYLVAITGGDPDIAAKADALYEWMMTLGLDVIYDDRDASPGVKLNDADLIGIPVRVTLGERSLKAGGVELKRRDRDEREIVALDEALHAVSATIAELTRELME
jgi:prolyl-tRNA synthetase